MWARGSSLGLLVHPKVLDWLCSFGGRKTVRLTGEISFWSSLALALRSTSLRLSGWILPTPCLFVPASPISQTPGKEGWWGSYLGRLSNVLVVTKQLVNGGSGCWGLGWLKDVLFRRSKSTPPTHTPAGGRNVSKESEGSLDWVLSQLSPLLGLSALGKLHALFHSEAAWERAGALSGKQA